jgi:hypothetical protein
LGGINMFLFDSCSPTIECHLADMGQAEISCGHICIECGHTCGCGSIATSSVEAIGNTDAACCTCSAPSGDGCLAPMAPGSAGRCEPDACGGRCQPHGTCDSGACTCDEGWSGKSCETRAPPPPPPSTSASCTGPEFFSRTAAVTTACCDDNHPCIDGLPTVCTTACATVLLPMQHDCVAMVTMMGMTDVIDTAVAECPQAAPCSTGPEFFAYTQTMTAACCGDSPSACASGFPVAACSIECAAVLLPMQAVCGDLLTMMGMDATFRTAVVVCQGGGAASGH